jgi:phage terminase large subunit-like protein
VSSDVAAPPADAVTDYARSVVSGDLPAGALHRLACERHLRDLETQEAQGLRWRPELARKVIAFFGLFRHFKGEWGGQPIVLEPWQQFIIGSLFGWVKVSDGLRRFRNAFLELPRGNGKSTIAGGLAVYATFFDNEPGADGFCFATKKDQARVVFQAARQMVMRSSAIREFGVKPYKNNIHHLDTESKLEILGSDSENQDGLRPHFAVADELHRHPTPDMVDIVESGMGPRRQPLLVELTTKGETEESVYGSHYRISEQVLQQVVDIPEWFAFIAAADPEDDWTKVETWRKANPNFGISIKPDFLEKELKKALANPQEQAKFRRLYCGQRAEAASSYFPLLIVDQETGQRGGWDVCAGDVPDDVLRDLPCWMGIDLSSKVDITAAVLVWWVDDLLVIRPRLWLPALNLQEKRRRDRVPYPLWVEQGYLHTTPGNVVDQDVIRAYIVECGEQWDLQEIAYDPWNAGELAKKLKDDDGFKVIECRQGYQTMSEPTKRLLELSLQGKLRHGAHPALRWMASNVKVRKDANGNVAPDKEKSRQRIDGVVGAIIGLWRAMHRQVRKQSRYMRPGARMEAVGWK